MRMARKPSALARELLKNFPKGKRRRGGRRRRKRGGGDAEGAENGAKVQVQEATGAETPEPDEQDAPGEEQDAPGEPREEPDEQPDAQPGEERDAA
jgi:hypothetical protein